MSGRSLRAITTMLNPHARMLCAFVSHRMLHDATARSVGTEGNPVSTNFER